MLGCKRLTLDIEWRSCSSNHTSPLLLQQYHCCCASGDCCCYCSWCCRSCLTLCSRTGCFHVHLTIHEYHRLSIIVCNVQCRTVHESSFERHHVTVSSFVSRCELFTWIERRIHSGFTVRNKSLFFLTHRLYTPVSQKKILLSITLVNIGRFLNGSTDRHSSTISLLKIPSHLKRVATIPAEFNIDISHDAFYIWWHL